MYASMVDLTGFYFRCCFNLFLMYSTTVTGVSAVVIEAATVSESYFKITVYSDMIKA